MTDNKEPRNDIEQENNGSTEYKEKIHKFLGTPEKGISLEKCLFAFLFVLFFAFVFVVFLAKTL